jgi:hypothetical protein
MADEVKVKEVQSSCNGFGKAWVPEEKDCKTCEVEFPKEYKACKELVVNRVKEMRQEAGQFASTAEIDTSKKKETVVDETKKDSTTEEKKDAGKKEKKEKVKKERKNGLPGVNVKDAVRKMIKEGKDATAIKTEITKLYVAAGKTEDFAKKRAKTIYASLVRKPKEKKETPATTPPATTEPAKA